MNYTENFILNNLNLNLNIRVAISNIRIFILSLFSKPIN